jgi:hypothetical protein
MILWHNSAIPRSHVTLMKVQAVTIGSYVINSEIYIRSHKRKTQFKTTRSSSSLKLCRKIRKKQFLWVVLLQTIDPTWFLFCSWLTVQIGYDQWGRKLEGWSNTATRLAGRRRVTQQVSFCTWWTGRTACLFRTVPIAMTGAAQLRADAFSSCCYIINVHNHPSWATPRKESMAWYSSRPMPSLWFWP